MHFVVQNALAALAAVAIARLAASDREPWRRALSALVAYGFVVHASMLALGLTIGLSNLNVEGLLAVVAAPLAFLAWRKGPLPELPKARDASGGSAATAAAALGAAVAVWVAGSTLLGTRFGIDDFTYHAAVPAHWLARGAIDLAPFTYQSYYPMNAEVLTLWFLLPLHADAWAGLGDLYGWLLVAVSAYGLARSVGCTAASGLWAATLASVSRDMLSRMGTFAQPDVVGTGMALAALAFLAPRAPSAGAEAIEPPPHWTAAALAGLALGFALGCKVGYATVLAAVIVWWLLGGNGVRRKAGALGGLVVLGAATAATGGYWYLRNALLTGNPFYPAALGPLSGPLDAVAQGRTKLWTWIVSSPGGPGAWSEGLARLAGWPATVAILAVAGIAWTAVRLVGRRRVPNAGFQSLLLAVALMQIAQFPFLPFSATFNRPYAGLEGIATRYLILPFVLGVSLLAGALGARLGRMRIVNLAALLCFVSCLPPLAGLFGGFAVPVGVVIGGALAGVALDRNAGLRRRLASSGTALALLAVAFAAAALAAPLRQRATDRNLFAVAREGMPVGEGWKALEALPSGSRVAFFMADPFDYTHFYPIFGRALRLVPVPLELDGSPRVPLHLRPARRWWSDWDDLDRPLNAQAFRANLARSRVDFVAVTRWTLGRWPAQRQALRAGDTERPVYADACTEIWRVAN